jgi:hypothetical protein
MESKTRNVVVIGINYTWEWDIIRGVRRQIHHHFSGDKISVSEGYSQEKIKGEITLNLTQIIGKEKAQEVWEHVLAGDVWEDKSGKFYTNTEKYPYIKVPEIPKKQ